MLRMQSRFIWSPKCFGFYSPFLGEYLNTLYGCLIDEYYFKMSISLCHSSKLYLFLNVYRVNRDSDKMIFERLQKEFEAARASQTEGSSLILVCYIIV